MSKSKDAQICDLRRRLKKSLMREWLWKERARKAEYHLGRAVAEFEFLADEGYREEQAVEWGWMH